MIFSAKKFYTAITLLPALSHAQSTIVESAGSIVTPAASITAAPVSSTVISFYIDDADSQDLVGSVIAAEPTMTVYSFECAPGVTSDDCGFGPGGNLTILNGNTHIVSVSEGDVFNFQASCVAYNTESVVCSDTIGGSEANTQDGQPSIDTNQAVLMPLTVTAGLDKLASASATATDSTSASGSKGSSSAKKTSSKTGTSTSTSTATGSVPSSNAGRVQVFSAIGLLSVAAVMISM